MRRVIRVKGKMVKQSVQGQEKKLTNKHYLNKWSH